MDEVVGLVAGGMGWNLLEAVSVDGGGYKGKVGTMATMAFYIGIGFDGEARGKPARETSQGNQFDIYSLERETSIQ